MDPAEPPDENDILERRSSSPSSLSSEGFYSSLVFLRTTDPEIWERLNKAEFTSLTRYFFTDERSPILLIIYSKALLSPTLGLSRFMSDGTCILSAGTPNIYYYEAYLRIPFATKASSLSLVD